MTKGERIVAGLLALSAPADLLLTAAVRRLAKRRSDAFVRLGAYESAAFLIRPNETPVAFRLAPRRRNGGVRLVRRDDPGPYAAAISGPIADLLAVFDASGDADAAFFGRRVEVEGDTAAVVALHNALESAELSLIDLLPLSFDHRFVRAMLRRLRTAAAVRQARA
jgi:predicted lipid carrier protein YhbT